MGGFPGRNSKKLAYGWISGQWIDRNRPMGGFPGRNNKIKHVKHIERNIKSVCIHEKIGCALVLLHGEVRQLLI